MVQASCEGETPRLTSICPSSVSTASHVPAPSGSEILLGIQEPTSNKDMYVGIACIV